jgi:hypothetical protein
MKSYCPLTKIEKGDDENDFLDGLNIQMRVFVFSYGGYLMTSWSPKFYEPIMIIILKFSIPECMCSKYIFAKSTVTI